MSERKKIIVVADDFTGAAEIGGIGLRNGLNVAIETEAVDSNDIDLLVMATDTRSMRPTKAMLHVMELTRKLNTFRPFLIYKKIDSVLRGNITEELEAQLKASHLTQCIIIAGNPVFNRVIKDGKYYINEIPLNYTCFAHDSQPPLQTNDVLKILSPAKEYPLVSRKIKDILPEKGLIMGDVESIEDLHRWALLYSNNILFAGAAGFFNSLLNSLNLSKTCFEPDLIPFGDKRLFILGSSYPKDRVLLENMIQDGHYLSNMPMDIYYNKDYSESTFKDWEKDVLFGLNNYQKVIISSIHNESDDPEISKRVKQEIAKLVKKIFKQYIIDELLVEGGSTTSEILNALQIKRLIPLQELDYGVIRMRVADSRRKLCLTTKPGSYLWPENVWLKSKIDQLNKNISNNVLIHK